MCDTSRCPHEREVWGHIRFTAGARFRCTDAARIPCEPFLESHKKQGLIQTTTRSELMKNGQTPGRIYREVTVVAHAWGVSGLHWGKVWLDLRKELNMSAKTDGVLHQNIDRHWKPVPGTLLHCDKVTWLVRRLCTQELHMSPEQALEYSSHSCKAWALSIGAKRGVHRDTRRIWGYHAKGKQE